MYYGAYANASKLRAVVRPGWEPPAVAHADSSHRPDLEPPTPFQQRCRIRWAQLIRRVWLQDPLLCPDCSSEMYIVSFITEPRVVDRILRHLKWRHREPLSGTIRPPPTVLKVAESLPPART